MTEALPIEGVLPALFRALDGFGAAVLVAEPDELVATTV